MNLVVKNDREFVRKLIDWFSLFLPKQQQLGPVEKEFFLENVILYNQNVDLASRRAVVALSKKLEFKRESDVYRYRTKLKEKIWLKQTEVSFDIPSIFKFSNGIPSDISLRVKLLNKKDAETKNREEEGGVLAGSANRAGVDNTASRDTVSTDNGSVRSEHSRGNAGVQSN